MIMKPLDMQLDLQGKRGRRDCVGIKETKGSFSVIKEDLLPTHPLLCGDSFLFFGRRGDSWRDEAGREGYNRRV